MSVFDFRDQKGKRPLCMVTSYDSWSAKLLDATEIDAILVGDSAATVMHGFDSTVHATMDMMVAHTESVARGCKGKLIVGDMPFLSYRGGVTDAVNHAGRLIRAGAQAVKLEGIRGHKDVVRACVESGIPVMGHLGLTPQSVHQLGGMRVQGRSIDAAAAMKEDALALQNAGAFAIVLECVPSSLARDLTQSLSIPTIGIGAGRDVDGQILVLQDLLGLSGAFKPKFLRTFGRGDELVRDAIASYITATRSGSYPNIAESYE
jgi:3-methyl-2-oxobutanoate hydroxymethyltransferase